MIIHLGWLLPTTSRDQPGPSGGDCPARVYPLRDTAMPRGPYAVLLRVGFAMPVLLPVPRCALTAPFHLFPIPGVVCFLWHCPWGRPRRQLAVTLISWSPDFPPRLRKAIIRPSDAPGYHKKLVSFSKEVALKTQVNQIITPKPIFGAVFTRQFGEKRS